MKSFLLSLFCFAIYVTAMAQTAPAPLTVKGIAIDSATSKPVSYATVALMDVATQKSVRGTLTKDDGSFEMKSVSGKAFQLVFAVVGYAPKSINIKATDVDVNLGKILISPSKNQLKEVSITAQRPIMKQEVDRLSYDVQADPESKALTALDMMRKVPLLSVDANDNIKLKGNNNYKILVNGKESALMGKSPSDVLKAMPADNIEKIEVITTPPAKYDAEGLAGIINIITKKNADQGYNASISGRYNSVFGPGLYGRVSVKQGKIGLSLFGGINRNNGFDARSGNTQQIFGGTNTQQDGLGHNQFHNYFSNGELSYEIDSLNLLTASFELFHGSDDQVQNQSSITTNNDGSPNQSYNQHTIGDNTFQGLDLTLNYQLGFKRKKDQLLTLSYKYSYSPNTSYSNNIFSQRVNLPDSDQANFYQNNSAGEKAHTIQFDYAEPFKVITLEAGAKAILRTDYSNFNRSDFDDATQEYTLVPKYTNDFNYQQNVYSLYNSYQLKLENWTGKAGIRIEHTSIDANFLSAGVPVSNGYNNIIPSISIQRKFKTASLNLGFTQRIQRPGIYQLNPFIDNSNPKFLSTGNPNLRPELNNSFEFTYSNFSKNSFTAGLSYQFSNNSIQNVSSLIGAPDVNGKQDTTLTTFQNLGSNRTLGLNLNANFTITKQFSLSINGFISEIWLRGTYNGQFYTNSGLTGNTFSNASYKFDSGYRIGVDAGFFSGDVNLQGKSSNFIYNSLVITKEFLKKNATISLVANNPEMKYHDFRNTTTTSEYYQTSFNQNPYRTFAVRFSYKFGKLNSEIKKNQHGINNDDSKGGGKGGGGNG